MIRIEALGDPLLSGPQGPIKGRATYKRRLALLSVLAAARGRPVGRERLMALLWSELRTESARHSLSEALYVLRKELGEGAFLAVGGEVGLDPAHAASDVDEFERALEEGRGADAARIYRGPFMDGFHVADAPEYERWLDAERDRLARLHARAVQGLAEEAEAAGDHAGAAEWWRRLAAHDPYSSRVALRLARALRAAGEGAAALRQVEAHAAFLHEELGVGADAELRAFAEEVRAEARPLPPRAAAPPPTVHAEPAPEPEPVPPAPAEPRLPAAPPPSTAAHPRPRTRRRAAFLPGALVALLALAAALAALRPREAEPPRYDPRRIAVLYFDDGSPGGELGYLARGLTETLIHELGQVQALDVVSRNGVKPYRDGRLPLDSVAARLRVGIVVEGSVHRAGDRVRVAVQLVDANTQTQLESRVIERPLADVVGLDAALAGEVSRSLRKRLGREVRLREVGRETRSAEALRLVMRAEEARDDAAGVARGRAADDVEGARRLLARADSLLAAAAAADPRWTRPVLLRGWVAIAAAELMEEEARPPRLRSAEAAAARVLQRDPSHPEALELRGTARFGLAVRATGTAAEALEAAEADLRAAIAADSSRAGAWAGLSRVMLARGRFAEAGIAARRALRADAFLEAADAVLLRVYFGALTAGDHRLAGESCAEGARHFPGDWRFVECRLTLLREDPSRAPDPALAWRLVAELEQMDPAPRAAADGRAYAPLYRRMVAAAVSARAGDGERARAEAARARVLADADADARVALAYDEAYLRALLGEDEAARERIGEYLAARPALRPFVARSAVLRGYLTPEPPAGAPPGTSPAPPAGAHAASHRPRTGRR